MIDFLKSLNKFGRLKVGIDLILISHYIYPWYPNWILIGFAAFSGITTVLLISDNLEMFKKA